MKILNLMKIRNSKPACRQGRLKITKGFTLVEVLVAVGILVMVLAVAILLEVQHIRLATYNTHRLTAENFAQEYLTLVGTIRDNNVFSNPNSPFINFPAAGSTNARVEPDGSSHNFKFTTSGPGTVTLNNIIYTITITVVGSNLPIWDQTETLGATVGSQATALTAQDGTYLYVIGQDCSSGTCVWRIEGRLKTDTPGHDDGNLIPTSSHSYAGNTFQPRSIVADNDYLYITGIKSGSSGRTEKRRKSDLSEVWAPEYSVGSYGITVDGSDVFTINRQGSGRWQVDKRSISDGSLESSVYPPYITGTTDDNNLSIASDANDIYVAGNIDPSTPGNWGIEKRRKSDLALESGWGITGGGSGNNAYYINSIATNDSFIYTAGAQVIDGKRQWHIEKRQKDNGNLVWQQSWHPSGSAADDIAKSITLDDSNIYVTGVIGGPAPKNWGIAKLQKDNNGSFVWTVNQAKNNISYPLSIGVDGTYVYTAGYDKNGSNYEWRIEKRYK